MRWLLCLFLLLPSLLLNAQEEEERLFVYVNINSEGQTSQSTATPGESPFSLPFFTQLRQRLTAEGVEAVFLTDDEGNYPEFFESTADHPGWADSLSPVLVITVRTYGDYDALFLSPFAAYEFEPLPMGFPYWTSVVTIKPDVENAVQSGVEFATGTGLYLIQECELAQPYFDQSLQNDALIENGILLYRAIHFYRGNCAYFLGDQFDAIGDYIAGMDYEGIGDEQNSLPLYNDALSINLAYAYIETGEPEKARDVLDEQRNVDYGLYSTREMERFLERADLYLALGEGEAAVEEITTLIELAGDTEISSFAADEIARLYAERGWRYAQAGMDDAALLDYDRALESDSTYPKTYYWRGILRYENEDFEAAQEDFETFLELAPDYYNYYEYDLDSYAEEAEKYLAEIEE